MTDLSVPAGPARLEDLDGWTPADLTGWLDTAAPVLVRLEEATDRWRLAVGLVLYQLRLEAGDGAYGIEVAQLAERLNCSKRTLARWRAYAENELVLPAPDERTSGRRLQIVDDARCDDTMASLRGREHAANSRKQKAEPGGPVEVVAKAPPPPRHEQPTLPDADAWGRVAAMSVHELASRPRSELVALQRRIAEALRLSPTAAARAPQPRPARQVEPRFKR